MSDRRGIVLFALIALAACGGPSAPTDDTTLAPLLGVAGGGNSAVVPDEYIVALRGAPPGRNSVNTQSRSMAALAGAEVVEVFGNALNGFAMRADGPALARIRANPAVEYIEPVQVFRAVANQTPTPSWGLDRIDQGALPLNNTFSYPTGGVAVHLYIIDTGILLTHSQFSGRMGSGYDAITQGGTGNDCDGHGTHVAGTAGGTTYGIMKTATMHPVRVLDCNGSGTTTSVLAGINWVISNAVAPAVSNMSIGGGPSTSLDNATNNMVAAGIVSAVAAGNSSTNACTSSPASAASALTVGSTTITDVRSSFSNFGTCLDLFAPGSGVFSSYIGGNNATATLSGTSMASPHVAGVAALYRSFNPSHTPAQVMAAIVGQATPNRVTSPGTGSPNLLLYSGFIGGGPPPPPNQSPIASLTYQCVPRSDGAVSYTHLTLPTNREV